MLGDKEVLCLTAGASVMHGEDWGEWEVGQLAVARGIEPIFVKLDQEV